MDLGFYNVSEFEIFHKLNLDPKQARIPKKIVENANIAIFHELQKCCVSAITEIVSIKT